MKFKLIGRLLCLVVAAPLSLALGACSDSGNSGNGCGNGTVDPTLEECDDGNNDDFDGCTATCTMEHGWVCGDGSVAGTEVCDPGQQPAYCSADCTTITGACGDGIIQPSAETCDGPRGCVGCYDGRGFECDASTNTCVGMGPSGSTPASSVDATTFCTWLIRALGGEGEVHVCGSTQFTIYSVASCVSNAPGASALGACTVAELEDWGLSSGACSMLTTDPACAG